MTALYIFLGLFGVLLLLLLISLIRTNLHRIYSGPKYTRKNFLP